MGVIDHEGYSCILHEGNTFCDQKCHWLKSTDCLERPELEKQKRHALVFVITITALVSKQPFSFSTNLPRVK